jgi:hypothetical protein
MATTTIQELVTTAMRKLRLVGSGQQPDPREIADGLSVLRTMLDAWSLEDLLIPYHPTEAFDLDSARQIYTVGDGGDWNTVRPEAVMSLRVLYPDGQSSPVIEASVGQFQYIPSVQVRRPRYYLAQRDARFMFIEFDSFPEAGTKALLTSLKPFNVYALEGFGDGSADPVTVNASGFTLTGVQAPIEFPSGYQQAIEYNLALHLAPEYGRAPSQEVMAFASRSKSLIKRRNYRPMTTRIDQGALGYRPLRGTYDVTSGPGW